MKVIYSTFFLIFVCACVVSAGYQSEKKPNIVFFIVDDQQRDFYSFLPDRPQDKNICASVTPSLNALAGEGVVLADLYVPSPICVPSRFSILTGQYCSRAINQKFVKEAKEWGYPRVAQNPNVTAETRTIVHMLKEAGYKTGAVGKNHVIEVPEYVQLSSDSDIRDPFVMEQVKRNTELEREAWQAAGFDYADRLYHDNIPANGPRELNPHNLDWITDGAIEFIESVEEAPLFLYVAVTTPHEPVGHWESGNRLATPDGILSEAPDVLPSKDEIRARLMESGYTPDHKYWKTAGDNLWTDAALGAVITKLKMTGKWENTVLIYFNDHGVESGKTTLYQGGMQSLAVIHGPKHYVKGKRIETALASSIDFGQTIANWAGVSNGIGKLDGVDLGPLLLGTKEQVRESVYGEIGATRVIIKDGWKYLAFRQPEVIKKMSLEDRQKRLDASAEHLAKEGRPPFPNTADQPFSHSAKIPGGWSNTWPAMERYPAYFDEDQLYDLSKDPNEQINLARDPKNKARLEEMKAELSHYLGTLPGQFAEF